VDDHHDCTRGPVPMPGPCCRTLSRGSTAARYREVLRVPFCGECVSPRVRDRSQTVEPCLTWASRRRTPHAASKIISIPWRPSKPEPRCLSHSGEASVSGSPGQARLSVRLPSTASSSHEDPLPASPESVGNGGGGGSGFVVANKRVICFNLLHQTPPVGRHPHTAPHIKPNYRKAASQGPQAQCG